MPQGFFGAGSRGGEALGFADISRIAGLLLVGIHQKQLCFDGIGMILLRFGSSQDIPYNFGGRLGQSPVDQRIGLLPLMLVRVVHFVFLSEGGH